MSTARHRGRLVLLASLCCIGFPALVLAWAETDDDDFFVDAPWRTMRSYLPVVFFAPETKGKRIVYTKLSNYDMRRNAVADTLFQDFGYGAQGAADRSTCRTNNVVHRAQIIDPNGRRRGGLDTAEPIRDFWHYVVRLPVACIGVGPGRGRPGVHYVKGEMDVVTRDGRHRTYSRLMRVAVSRDPLPRFSPVDRYYDIHIHTVAEQTTWSVARIDAARKMFGGPLAMVVESAYALGLVEEQLDNGNWSAFRDKLATTDHNVFFSRTPYDASAKPAYGPTAATDGHDGEFAWYREHLGSLAGEEVTLQGSGRFVHSDQSRFMGSHYLTYEAPHFEGPWHGGRFRAPLFWGYDAPGQGVDNPNTIRHVHRHMGRTTGFGYAAHPFSQAIGWSARMLEDAIGLPPRSNRKRAAPRLLNAAGDDFVFKGLQVWNGLASYKATQTMDVGEQDRLDPFTGNRRSQRFVLNAQAYRSRDQGLLEYFRLLKRGLSYEFKEEPRRKFIRKLYISAGSDAHGDFNFETSNVATILAELDDLPLINIHKFTMSSNAFGIVRTYTLTSQRGFPAAALSVPGGPQPPKAKRSRGARARASSRTHRVTARAAGGFRGAGGRLVLQSAVRRDPVKASVAAYRDGNTILTDGPICAFTLDSNCRHDSGKTDAAWHDGSCVGENADGRIGGSGAMDGERTALFVRGQDSVRLRTVWDEAPTYYPQRAPTRIRYSLTHVRARTNASRFAIPSGPRRRTTETAPGRRIDLDVLPSALLMRGDTPTGSCVTNPIWTVPVFFEVRHPDRCPFKPGELQVTLAFGMSMDTTGSRAEPSPSCSGDPRLCTSAAQVGQAYDDDLSAHAYGGASLSIQALDANGLSSGPAIPLTRDVSWRTSHRPAGGFPIDDASLTAANSVQVDCPRGQWNALEHRAPSHKNRRSRVFSYALFVRNLRDTHGNKLNDIARTITLVHDDPLSIRHRDQRGLRRP